MPEACGATDVSLRLRGALLLASTMPDYYGSFVETTTLRGRYLLGERLTLSFAADVFAYRYVNNASLASQGASAGPATAAFHQTFAIGAAAASSWYARVLLPLDTARQNGVETGLELGGSLRALVGSRVVIDGGWHWRPRWTSSAGRSTAACSPPRSRRHGSGCVPGSRSRAGRRCGWRRPRN